MAGLSKWGYQRRTCKSYSMPFKLQVVAEVEAGTVSWKKVQRKYGIQGRSTVLVWLRKHGRLDWRSTGAMKRPDTPNKRIRELEAKLKRLEAEKEILNRAIDLADQELKTDIRKKYLALLSEASPSPAEQQGQPNADPPKAVEKSGGADSTASD